MIKTMTVPRTEHSPRGPSSSKRWLNCPGSVNATKDIADRPSRFAAEGTAAHYISELARRLNQPAAYWLGWKVQADGYEFLVDAELAGSAQEFIDWCEERPGLALIEQRICFDRWVPGGFGTLDDGRLTTELTVITDFKHGKGVQEYAKDNTQLMLQALGVIQDYDYLYGFKEFELRICQPRLDHKDSWKISADELRRWVLDRLVAQQAVEKVLAGREFKAGEWCRFCRIRETCAVRAQAALEHVIAEVNDFEPIEALSATDMAPGRLSKLADALPILKSWIKDFERYLVGTLMAGEKELDWKLVQGRSNRQWDLDEQLMADTLEAHGLKAWNKKVRSVADVEKEMGKKNFAVELGRLVVKPVGKPVLAPRDDPRPEMSTTELNDFEPIEDEE